MSRTSRLFINDVDRCVDEMLESIAMQNAGQRLLDGHRVILREDIAACHSAGLVSTICGGGSGHEPFAAGFVGRGMLSAAVAGSVFASTPPADILAAIEAVASPAGTLLIVANYTGDRLNFGIALERAKSMGHKIEMVVVGEDCALESSDKTAGRRGLVGIVMVMKIAGALSEEGKSLEEIAKICSSAASNMGTIGVSLSGCSIPGTGSSFQLDQDEMELGLGAHGEAGVKRMKLLPADETVEVMVNHMTSKNNASHIALQSGSKVSVTMNNLGGLSVLEMHVLSRKVITALEERGVVVERFYSGHYMTSLDMAGFNLNVMVLNDLLIKCLDAETNAPAWPRMSVIGKRTTRSKYRVSTSVREHATESQGDSVSSGKDKLIASTGFLSGIRFACEALIKEEACLNDLDTSSGDGDCGSTLRRGTSLILSKLDSWKGLTVSSVLHHIATCAESSMGGASGGLYSLFFTAASRHATGTSVADWKRCLDAGIEVIIKYGKAEPGDRTMLDALTAASKSFEQSIAQGLPVAVALSSASAEVAIAAKKTANMKAKAGRASYVAADLLTQPDPGATAVAIWLDAINRFVNS